MPAPTQPRCAPGPASAGRGWRREDVDVLRRPGRPGQQPRPVRHAGLAVPGVPHTRLDDHHRAGLAAARRSGRLHRPPPPAGPRSGRLVLRLAFPGMARHQRTHRRGPRCLAGMAVASPGVVFPVRRPARAGEMAAVALPAALGRRHDHQPPCPTLPGPDPAARSRQGVLDPLHRPGARPARLRPVRGGLREPGRESGARVRGLAVPGPLRPARLHRGGAGPPGRPRRPHSRPAHPAPADLRALPVGRARTDPCGWPGCTARTCSLPGPPAPGKPPCSGPSSGHC